MIIHDLLNLVIADELQMSHYTLAATLTTSPILCRRATVIRHGLVSARRPAATTRFHGQERDLTTEPSLWPAQLYGTVYQQQFV